MFHVATTHAVCMLIIIHCWKDNNNIRVISYVNTKAINTWDSMKSRTNLSTKYNDIYHYHWMFFTIDFNTNTYLLNFTAT